MKQFIQTYWLRLIAIILVLGALYPDFPYAYFQLMNWVVAGAAVLATLEAKKNKQEFGMWIMILIAVIFNPISPLYFRADIWQIADIVVAAVFTGSFVFLRNTER